MLGVVGQQCCVRLHAALRTTSDWRYWYTLGSPGVCPTQSLESQLFLVQFKDAFISTFQRPDLHQRKYQFLEEKHSLLGSLPQLSARRTLYNNSVFGNCLRPKGIAKVSGILEGSDFNIKSIYERLRKGLKRKWTQKEVLRNKMQRKYLVFFAYSYSLESSLKGCKEK